MSQSQTERDVEKPFLLFMFFISASFTYGALLVYPLYQAVAASKGQEEVDSVQGGIILMGAKYASILTHNLLSRCWTSLRGLQLQVSCYLVFSAVCLCIAACDVVSEAATLIAVSSLYFTNSNVIAGPLWPVPSEERSKIRMLFYYACCPAGCLWTALASMCLAREEYRSNWGLRSAVIILPLCVTLVSWLMLPADGFWTSERMRQKQLEREEEMAEEQRQLEEKRQKKEAKQKTKKIEEEPDDFEKFGEEEPENEEQGERPECKEPNLHKAPEDLESDQAKATDAKDGSRTETKPSLRTLTCEAPPLPPEVSSPKSGNRSPAPPDGPMSPLGGLYKQAARMSFLAPPLEGLPALPRLSAAARASQKRQRRHSRQSRHSQRSSRNSASSRESRPTGRRRSTMEQVRGTFKDRKTVITRMSFYTPLNPVLQRELGSIAGTDRASVFPGRLTDVDSAFDEEQPQQSPWRNGRFRVLVGTQCASLYCVTFWGYSVFPMLINEQGPSLELISFMYSLEGAAQVVCTILLMPFLDSRIFVKYFSTAFLLLFSAPITVCFLGKIHWFFYLLCLLLVDVLLCVCNALLSVVVLRSLPWDQIMIFYNIACTLGGVLSGTSFVQMPLKALVGSWELASVIGHGVPFVLLLLLYATHIQAMKELWDLLLEPVRRTELGDWDPDDLEEEDELENPEEPPSLLTDKADKAEKADKEKGESWLE